MNEQEIPMTSRLDTLAELEAAAAAIGDGKIDVHGFDEDGKPVTKRVSANAVAITGNLALAKMYGATYDPSVSPGRVYFIDPTALRALEAP